MSLTTPHNPHRPHPHIGEIVNELFSKLAPFSALILIITCCIIAFVRLYVLDVFLWRLYGNRLPTLSDAQKRSFNNHHVALITKIILLIGTAYPILSIVVGHANPHTPWVTGSKVTLGDSMNVSAQLFCAMYVFELFYRDHISPISFAHHVGAIMITQSAIAMSINFDHESDAVYEIILCFVWGAFDVAAESWPHAAMILYRVYHKDHRRIAKIFYATAALETLGTTLETIVAMWLFGSLWDKWATSLKVATPILHTLFSAAQLYGVLIFCKMARGEMAKAKKEDEEKGGLSPELGLVQTITPGEAAEVELKPHVTVTTTVVA